MDYLILYEHVVREYESVLLLQMELERRGHTAKIRQLLAPKKLSYYFCRPKVLVASCMYDDEAVNSHVYNNIGRCDKVVNLHWEQMLSAAQEEEKWFNFDGAAKHCVQTCWGRKTSERLISHGMDEKNCPVTGAIMMDFLRDEFKGYFMSKKELCQSYGIDPCKRLAVYISSFGYASMDAAEVSELSRMAGVDFSGFAQTNRVSMQQTLDIFAAYLEKHDDVELVYRPHPSEWASPALLALEQSQARFHVIFKDSVKQWIVAADKIFIWMSTAIAEVYFAHKSCAVLRPVPIDSEYDPVIYQNARIITDYEGFAHEMDTQGTDFPINAAVIEGYFDQTERPAYMRMADLLEDVLQSPPRDKVFAPPFRPRANILKLFALWGVHVLSAIQLDPTRVSPFAGRIYGYVQKAKISKKQIQAMRSKISQCINAK